MLENLFDLVKSHSGEAIINNPAIPNEHNDAAINVASSSIFDTLKNAASNGNVSDIMSLFNGGNQASASPLASIMQNDMVKNLISKFGIDQNAANNVASSILPNALNSLVSKTADPNDSSFNFQDILSKITNGAGGFDIGNLVNQFTGGNNSQSGGGILDTVKGFFGK